MSMMSMCFYGYAYNKVEMQFNVFVYKSTVERYQQASSIP